MQTSFFQFIQETKVKFVPEQGLIQHQTNSSFRFENRWKSTNIPKSFVKKNTTKP